MSNLIHIPIEGRILDIEKKVDRAHGMRLMTRLLGMSDVLRRRRPRLMVLILVISH